MLQVLARVESNLSLTATSHQHHGVTRLATPESLLLHDAIDRVGHFREEQKIQAALDDNLAPLISRLQASCNAVGPRLDALEDFLKQALHRLGQLFEV